MQNWNFAYNSVGLIFTLENITLCICDYDSDYHTVNGQTPAFKAPL